MDKEVAGAKKRLEHAAQEFARLTERQAEGGLRSIFTPWLGQAVMIELANGHRLAGLMPAEEVFDGMGDSTVVLSQCIRIVDEDWNGPRRGESRWHGRRSIRGSMVGGICSTVDAWGKKYSLPKNRDEVVAELTNVQREQG